MSFRIRGALFLLSTLSLGLAAMGPVTDMTIFAETVSPDGPGFERDAIRIAGSNTVIGPLIKGNKGDRFKINVINNLDNPNMRKPTSIHWYGLFQDHGQNWADGPAFVTQCPIAGQGNSFLYDFRVRKQTGTYWYHSHLSTQYCDGLRGPLVIYDPRDPYRRFYDIDNEDTVITLGDWYHSYAKDIVIGVPDATLINGLGRAVGVTASELAVIKVEHGKRYRMRFINLACDPFYTVSIDGHENLTFIEVDGILTRRVTADSFDIFVGQRYSIILNADQPVGNYWIRAAPQGVSNFAGGIDSAILRYDMALEEEPTTLPNNFTNKLQEQSLIPLFRPGAPGNPSPGGADVVRRLNVSFDPATLKFAIDGASFTSPTVPALLQIMSGAAIAQTLLPIGSYIEVNRGDVVELTIPGLAAGAPHPFHLHGHAFDVVKSADSAEFNFQSPPRRDVVSTGFLGNETTIRFKADNPGPWFFHCHIDWHLELGFALVIAERVGEWNSTIKPPSAWDELCPIYNRLPPDDS